jgi:imidazoleglycerol phosphate dehydratase HisB
MRGENDHHKAEALFKASALALKNALEPHQQVPSASTKGEASFSTPREDA